MGQWLVILVIIIAAIRQLIKACASPVTTAKNSVTSYGKKVKGGKQKNRKGTKTTTKIPKKSIQLKRRSFSPVKKQEVAVAVAVAVPIAPVEKKEIDVSVAVAVAV